MIRTAAALTAFALAAPLAAQEAPLPVDDDRALGSVTGTLDLQPAEWRVMQGTETDGSHWSEEDGALSIRMSGVLDGTGERNRLVIAFDLTGPASSADATDMRIALTHPDFDRPLRATAEDISLDLTTMTQLSDSVVIAGGLNALLQVPEAEGDAGDVTLDANFQATLTQVEQGG